MREQLRLLRKEMDRFHIQAYLIPTDDFHGSENVGDHFKSRAFISGFTGSAGTLLVMKDMAGLWTDGRYFLQAANQLQDSGITLFKMGEKGVPSIEEYLRENLERGMVFAFDGRCMMTDRAECYNRIVQRAGASMETNLDLVNAIWDERPEMSAKPAWILPQEFSGQCCKDKISAVRERMEKLDADALLLASLDDICWLLNVRGNDVEHTPVVLSYLIIRKDQITWYLQQSCLDDKMKDYLLENGIRTEEYDQIYRDIAELPSGLSILYQPSKTNYTLVSSIPEGIRHIQEDNPTEILKAVKNPVEIENQRIAHIKDGVALTRFMYYLKKHAVDQGETEVSLADQIVRLRKEQGHYVEESFSPIIGYGDHGAIIHYSANEESDRQVAAEGFLLVDTGAHYLEGTTDTTRTFAMGPLTREEKEMYTAVLRAHINLSAARVKEGCSCQSLDILARKPLWDLGLNYNHGTGHGVGYLLNVHEKPNSFRPRTYPFQEKECVLQEGMITSDEPGIYLEGKYGIRLENMIVCRRDPEYDSFLSFEPLTMVPFEKEAILPELMTKKEIDWLNAYHAEVYEKIAPYLPSQEREWLHEATALLKD